MNRFHSLGLPLLAASLVFGSLWLASFDATVRIAFLELAQTAVSGYIGYSMPKGGERD